MYLILTRKSIAIIGESDSLQLALHPSDVSIAFGGEEVLDASDERLGGSAEVVGIRVDGRVEFVETRAVLVSISGFSFTDTVDVVLVNWKRRKCALLRICEKRV